MLLKQRTADGYWVLYFTNQLLMHFLTYQSPAI